MKKLRVFTNSEVACHKTCAAKHYYRYELLLKPRFAEHDARHDGHDAHGFQDLWWSGLTVSVEDALATVQNPLIRALMAGYDARWRDDNPWESVSVEQEHFQPYAVINGVQMILGCKLDGIVRHVETGELLVREFKTTAYDVQAGSFYWQSIRLNTQIDTYNTVLRQEGLNVMGSLYDVVHKPRFKQEKAVPPELVKWTKGKPATKNKPAEPSRPYANQRLVDESDSEFAARVMLAIGEDPEKFYARSVIKRTEDQAERFEEELEYFVNRMMNAPPHRNFESCMKFNRLCEYHGLCTGYAREEDYDKRDSRHEELEGAKQYEV